MSLGRFRVLLPWIRPATRPTFGIFIKPAHLFHHHHASRIIPSNRYFSSNTGHSTARSATVTHTQEDTTNSQDIPYLSIELKKKGAWEDLIPLSVAARDSFEGLTTKIRRLKSLLSDKRATSKHKQTIEADVGYLYLQLGDFGNALTHLIEATKLGKTSDELLFWLTVGYINMEEAEQALACAEQITNKQFQHNLLASVYIALEQHEAAIAELTALIELRKVENSVTFLMKRAQCYKASGQQELAQEDALAGYELAPELFVPPEPHLDPATIPDFRAMARDLASQSKFVEAMAVIKPLLEHSEFPDEYVSEFSSLLGDWETKEKDQQKLINELSDALQLDANNMDLLMERAEMYVLVNEKQKGLDDISRYISIEPENSEGYFKRSMLYDLMGQEPESFADLEMAFKCTGIPQAMVHFSMGKHHLRSDRYEEAVKDFDKSIALDNSNSEVHAAKGEALYKMSDNEEAVASLTTALSLGGLRNAHEVYTSLAGARLVLGDIEQCSQDIDLAFSCVPNPTRITPEMYLVRAKLVLTKHATPELLAQAIVHCDAAERLADKSEDKQASIPILYEIHCLRAKLLTACGRFSEALASLKEAEAFGIQPINILLLEAQTHATMGEYQRASDICDEAIGMVDDIQPGDGQVYIMPHIFVWRGLMHLKLGDATEAERCFECARKLEPETQATIDALKAQEAKLGTHAT